MPLNKDFLIILKKIRDYESSFLSSGETPEVAYEMALQKAKDEDPKTVLLLDKWLRDKENPTIGAFLDREEEELEETPLQHSILQENQDMSVEDRWRRFFLHRLERTFVTDLMITEFRSTVTDKEERKQIDEYFKQYCRVIRPDKEKK